MNKEETEQWLYETYQYTSNFDFSRLDKYEEANDDICIDDIILDYTMLYEFHKEEIERLNNIINELEKWLNEKICLNKNDKDYINGMTFVGVNLQMYQMFLDKLQELKGSDK